MAQKIHKTQPQRALGNIKAATMAQKNNNQPQWLSKFEVKKEH